MFLIFPSLNFKFISVFISVFSFKLFKVLGTIGHPLQYTEMKIVDAETGEVLPDGSKGVVKVKGPQVMAGYYKVIFICI